MSLPECGLFVAFRDQREQLRPFAADIVLRLERDAPLVMIVSGASRADPELAELLVSLHGDRLRNLAAGSPEARAAWAQPQAHS